MKNEMTTPASAAIPGSQPDSTKLASLLALAAGAVAMPQTSQADIIFTDLSANPVQVGFLGGGVSYMLQLPGTVKFGFLRTQQTVTTTFFSSLVFYRSVVAYDMFGAVPAYIQSGPGGFAAPRPYGQAWNAGGLPLTYTVWMGSANSTDRTPFNGYNNQYLGFTFVDSTAGNVTRYGWIEVSLNISFVNPTGTSGGPNVTIHGYGWDDTGAQPFMGQKPVPEPSSAALLVIGALALGAPGLRKWRQNRDTSDPS